MKTSNVNIKDKIIRKVNRLSHDKLKSIDTFIDKMENENSNKDEILSFAGSWKEFDDEFIEELTVKLPEKRKKDKNRFLNERSSDRY
jgi:hypothetical protein